MRPFKVFSAVTFASTFLLLLLFEAQLQSVVAQTTTSSEAEEVDHNEPTCSLNPSSKSDCSTADDASASTTSSDSEIPSIINDRQDLTRQVISLTDETFDHLTLTSTPATWLIMFKTDSCGICKKTKPTLDELSVDVDIVNHNDKELELAIMIHNEKQHFDEAFEEKDGTPEGPVYVWEEPTKKEGGEIPKGPVYIATIDAGGYSGRDITKRFGVDATPTILLLRNEGYNINDKDSNNVVVDSRSYYIYRGQRATYPLRSFVLGGYAVRKQMDMPPPLADTERKPQSYWGRVWDLALSPSAKWAGGIIGKLLLAWFVFVGLLGLFMRVHNYAWGDAADDNNNSHEEHVKEIEKEKAQGRKEYGESLEKEKAQGRKESGESQEERSTRRKKLMWEQKAKNRAKFAANKEAREKKKEDNKNEGNGDAYDDDDDDEYHGVGFSVKKSDAQKIAKESKKASKSKDN